MSEEAKEIVPEKELKYSNELALVEVANDSYAEMDLKAYRWTFININDSRNFRPRAADPDNPERKSAANICIGWGLSFFKTEKQAIDKLKHFCLDKPNLHKKLGTHIAEGEIIKSDGKNGNFDKELILRRNSLV
jgi:hypothetical protein